MQKPWRCCYNALGSCLYDHGTNNFKDDGIDDTTEFHATFVLQLHESEIVKSNISPMFNVLFQKILQVHVIVRKIDFFNNS